MSEPADLALPTTELALSLPGMRGGLDRAEITAHLAEHGLDASAYAKLLWQLATKSRSPAIKLRAATLIADVTGLRGSGAGAGSGPTVGTLHATVGLRPDMARLSALLQRLEPGIRAELVDILQSGPGPAEVEVPADATR